MSLLLQPAEAALTQRFVLDYPHEAARLLESMPVDEAASLLAGQPMHAAVRAWQAMSADLALSVLEQMPPEQARHLLSEAEPVVSMSVLAQLGGNEREDRLRKLDSEVSQELRALLAYPEDSAGRMMDARVSPLRSGMRVAEAIERLRLVRRSGLRELFVVDDEGRLTGRVDVQDLALAERELPLADITRAGLAGALVPILLRRFGQDPATAASIILTTVTDVVGFSSFLGIAALFAPLLTQSLK